MATILSPQAPDLGSTPFSAPVRKEAQRKSGHVDPLQRESDWQRGVAMRCAGKVSRGMPAVKVDVTSSRGEEGSSAGAHDRQGARAATAPESDRTPEAKNAIFSERGCASNSTILLISNL